MAKALVSNDSLVVSVETFYYLNEPAKTHEACSYPEADFELLSKFVQHQGRR